MSNVYFSPMDLFIRYLHFVSILGLFGTLLAENILIRKSLTRREVGTLTAIDAFFGISAISTLIAGLLIWFKYGKGMEFYLKNPVFLAKLGLFLAVGLLSIYPAIWFPKHRKGGPDDKLEVPGRIIAFLRTELALVLLIPLFAVLMARGVGLG